MATMWLMFLCGTSCKSDPEQTPQPPVEKEALKLEVLSTGLTSVEFRITPQDETMTYVAMITTKDIFESFENEMAYVQDDIAWFEVLAEEEGITLEEYLTNELHRGVLEDKAEDLDPETTYYLYAYGLTPQCLMLTDLFKMEFSTQSVDQIDLQFELKVENISYSTAEVNITPDSNTAKYFVNVMSEAEYLEWGGTDQAFVDHLNALRNYYLGMGATTEQIVANLAYVGAKTHKVDQLSANTTYIAYALGVNDDFFANSAVEMEKFATLAAVQTDMTFGVEINQVEYDRVMATVTPSNDTDNYICSVQIAESLDWYESEEEFMEVLLMDLEFWYGGVEASLRNGAYNLEYTGLTPETDYVVVCFGYDGAPTTGLFTFPFTTPAASGDPKELVVTLSVEELTYNSVRIQASPSVGAWYFVSYTDADTFDCMVSDLGSTDAAILALADADIDYGAEWFDVSRPEYLFEMGALLGVSSTPFNSLIPSTNYVAYAVAVDVETGELAAERGFSIPFTTLEKVYSSALVTFHFGDYYDGTELAELDPERFLKCMGSAVLPYTVEVNEDTMTWYTGFYSGDYTEWGCTDDDIYAELITYGYEWGSDLVSVDRESGVAVLPYDEPFTFLGIAQDWMEEYGYGTLEVVTLSADGVSPAEEFLASQTTLQRASKSLRPEFLRKPTVREAQPAMKSPQTTRKQMLCKVNSSASKKETKRMRILL